MIQLLFVDLEQKVEYYKFPGNYEFVGDVRCGDVLSGEMKLLHEVAESLGIRPLTEFANAFTGENEDLNALALHAENWHSPQEGLIVLNALLSFLKKKLHLPARASKPLKRNVRRLLASWDYSTLIDELETIRDRVADAAELSPHARFTINISEQ